jgi:hypothetical protein
MTSAPPVPKQLAAASFLGYAWGAVMLALSVAVTIPALSQGPGAAGAMLVPAVLAVASGVGAHGVRRRRWPYVALGASAAWIAFLVLVPLKVSLLGIAVNIAILGLVLTNLRRFR